jgi:hypothetical protein
LIGTWANVSSDVGEKAISSFTSSSFLVTLSPDGRVEENGIVGDEDDEEDEEDVPEGMKGGGGNAVGDSTGLRYITTGYQWEC